MLFQIDVAHEPGKRPDNHIGLPLQVSASDFPVMAGVRELNEPDQLEIELFYGGGEEGTIDRRCGDATITYGQRSGKVYKFQLPRACEMSAIYRSLQEAAKSAPNSRFKHNYLFSQTIVPIVLRAFRDSTVHMPPVESGTLDACSQGEVQASLDRYEEL